MLEKPMDIQELFPARKTRAQKRSFRVALQPWVTALGYACTVEQESLGCRNVMIGNPETADYLVTARYDADDPSGMITLLEIAQALPEARRDSVCFILFDRGKIGSDSYRRTHGKQTQKQLVIHLDDVGGGNDLCFIPTKQLKEDRRRLTSLYKACGYFGSKSLLVEEKFSYRSCHRSFPFGAGICAMRKNKKGRCIGPVKASSSLERTNITFLRAALVSFLCCDASVKEKVRKEMNNETL